MKKLVYFVVFNVILASAALVNAQYCGFSYPNGTNVGTTVILSSVQETVAPNTTILTLTFAGTNISCDPSGEYLKYEYYNQTTLQLNVVEKLDEDFDKGLLAQDPPSGFCTLSCPPPNKNVFLSNLILVISVNDIAPKFNQDKLQLAIDETTPPDVDILTRSNQLLYAFDNDYDETGMDARISFSVDNDKFKVLPSFEISYVDVNAVERINYIPRVGLKAPWNRRERNSVTFNLIAKDMGNPQNQKSIPVTVNIAPADLNDPQFLQNYYTALIDSSTQMGEVLPVTPETIKAVDGDASINDEILYAIIDNDSLELELIHLENGGVDVKLKSPVVPSKRKVAYVVIKATQKSNNNRFDTVVLAIELPLEVETTTTSTTTESTTGTTCPTYTTSLPTTCTPCETCPNCEISTTLVTCTSCEPCPTVSCETCPNCETPTTSTCPPFTTGPTDYTTTYSTNTTSSPLTTTLSTTPSTVTATKSTTVTHTGSAGTCPPCPTASFTETPSVSSSITTVVTGSQGTITTGSQGSTSTVCPTCPTPTTCPTCPTTTACPTHPPCLLSTCPPCDCMSSTTSSSSSKTESTTSTLDCTTKQPTTTTSSSPPKLTVTFKRDQYASEIIENSPAGTPIVAVEAVRSDGSLDIIYSLIGGEDSRYFAINQITGHITLASSLQKGSYVFHTQASVPTGEIGTAIVRVDAIQGYVIGEMYFGSPHYKFHIDERSAIGKKVGVIELRNPSSDIVPRIMSVDPEWMTGYFYLTSELVGSDVLNVSIFVNETFSRQYSGPRVVLDVSAFLTRTVQVSTAVDIEIDDINEAPFFGLWQPRVVGYPERTYFDPAVPMPIFTFKASDPDDGNYAVLSYHLDEKSINDFDIDANNGHLFAKGLNILSSADRNLTVTVKDLSGYSASLEIKVKSLKNDEVHVISASGSETLSDDDIASDLSSALGYDVIVLHKVKAPAAEQLKINNYDYAVTVYAVEKGAFVNREKFEKDLKASASQITEWTITEQAIGGPEAYEPEKLMSDVEAYTIATAVLASILGIILLAMAGYLFYLSKNDKIMPWSRLRNPRKGTIEIKEKDNDLGNMYSRSSDSSNSDTGYVNPRVTEESREFSLVASANTVTEADPGAQAFLIVGEKDEVYCPDTPTPRKSILKPANLYEEAYCPPTPTPAKSILKDAYQPDKEGEKGVSFDPTPEVIKVASTLQVDEINNDEEAKSDSSNDEESEDGDATVL